MKLTYFDGFNFRSKGHVVRCIITPIVHNEIVETSVHRLRYKCKITKEQLKRNLISAYIKDFLNLNFDDVSNDVTVYRPSSFYNDNSPTPSLCDIDMKELLLKNTPETVINYTDNKFYAAIDTKLINILKESFLIEMISKEHKITKLFFNSEILKDRRFLGTELFFKQDISCTTELLNSLATIAGIHCSMVFKRRNQEILFD